MAASGLALLTDEGLRRRISEAAAADVRERFCTERIVPMYEAHYARICAEPDGRAAS
jgi:hypothetical protein